MKGDESVNFPRLLCPTGQLISIREETKITHVKECPMKISVEKVLLNQELSPLMKGRKSKPLAT